MSSSPRAGSYDSASGPCKRSAYSYPALWAAAHSPSSFSFTACSQATTGDVVSKQLGPLNSSTGLVSITVGGNDAGFADTMTTCAVQGESACLARVARARKYINTALPHRFDTVYDAIKGKAPHTRVVVLGYARFFKLNGSCSVGLSERSRAAINAAANDINSLTKKRAHDHGFRFADVNAAFAGHELCSGRSWLHSVTFPIDESYRPTAIGQSRGYLPVFSSAA
ncbi:SGNH/GDSL hydrolase family protein [Streptomyces gilvosporeus]|uniref:SGNH/GDSL hydrolase family protein n=1 Tax=Streptomyces gilvosporeus TaxID=553510 RepID=UPI0022B27564|nr:SGNH/GDSL hydrolase family protein [Streptomyces gilvosporeus]